MLQAWIMKRERVLASDKGKPIYPKDIFVLLEKGFIFHWKWDISSRYSSRNWMILKPEHKQAIFIQPMQKIFSFFPCFFRGMPRDLVEFFIQNMHPRM